MTTQENNEQRDIANIRLSAAEAENKPRKIGCLTYACVIGLIFVVLLWFNVLRSVPLRISPETTHITEPRTPDGLMVDYVAAVEQKLYPPEMKTDDNGFRMIFREIGPIEHSSDPDHTQQRYEKLGLDMIHDKPTLQFADAYEYFGRLYERAPEEFDEILNHGKDLRLKRERKELARIDAIFGEDSDTEKEAADEMPLENANEEIESFRPYDVWNEIAKYPDMHELPIVRQWLDDNNTALDLVVEASKKPVLVPPLVVPKESRCAYLFFVPDIQGIRALARGLENRVTIRVAQGDIDGAIEDILACHRLGRHLTKYAFFVGMLVGIASEGIAHDIAYNGNLATQADAEQLKRLLDGLNDLPPRGTWEDVMEYERLGMLDLLRALMQDPGEMRKILGSIGYSPPPIIMIGYSGLDWNVVFQKVNKAFDADIAGTFTYVHPSLNPLRYLTLGSRSEEFGNFMIAMFMPGTESVREAMRRLECLDNLKRIQLAMFLYHAEHGTLPPTFTVDENGQALHSWRTLLLPYLGDESAAELFAQIRLDEPWDSEHNRQFHETNVAIYRCTSAAANKDGDSNYSVIVGDDLLFGNDGKGRSLDGFGRHMFLVVERKEGICWMRPDSDMTQTVAETGLVNTGSASTGSHHTGGCNVALRDGSVEFISQTTDHAEFIESVRGREEQERKVKNEE